MRDQNFSLQRIRIFSTPGLNRCDPFSPPWSTILGPLVREWGMGDSYDSAFWLDPGWKGDLWTRLGADVH